MAKSTGARTPPQLATTSAQAETKLEAFAEDLGRLLGEARNKANSWLAQRDAVAKHLEGVRDTANQLLQQLGISSANPTTGTKRGPGRPSNVQAAAPTRRRRRMSAEGRAKIAAAQRARWARQKAGKK